MSAGALTRAAPPALRVENSIIFFPISRNCVVSAGAEAGPASLAFVLVNEVTRGLGVIYHGPLLTWTDLRPAIARDDHVRSGL